MVTSEHSPGAAAATTRRASGPRARTAADLPAGRSENLAWHLCRLPGFSLTVDLDELGFAPECYPLRRDPSTQAPQHALLGTDGLYHPAVGDQLLCDSHTIGRTGHQPAPGTAPVPLLEVPRNAQCPVTRDNWPGVIVGSRLAAVRRQLVDALGPGCNICTDPWAQLVDHDHLTGKIRGYLCRWCNAAVDRCRHLDGCPYADYLNHPPANHLNLTHPDARRRLNTDRYRNRQHRYDLVMTGATSPPPPLPDHPTRAELDSPTTALAAELVENVGAHVVAAMSDQARGELGVVISDDGEIGLSPEEVARIELGWEVWAAIARAEGRDVALAWLVSANPRLSGLVPVTLIRQLRRDEVIGAVLAHVTGSPSA